MRLGRKNKIDTEANSWKSRRWGNSPRPSASQMPEWTKEFQTADWVATPNPESLKARQQRKARLILGSILASLPLSLLSCLFALGNSGPEPPAPAPVVQTSVPVSRVQAEIAAQRWLADAGLSETPLTWQATKTSRLPCYVRTWKEPDSMLEERSETIQCEIHTFRGVVDEKIPMNLNVTFSSVDDRIIGIHMNTDKPPQDFFDPEFSLAPQMWLKRHERQKLPAEEQLPDKYEEEIFKWARAWAENNQKMLIDLASAKEEEYQPQFGMDGWTLLPLKEPSDDLVNIPTVIWIGDGPVSPEDTNQEHYLATALFAIVQECRLGEGFGPMPFPTTEESETSEDTITDETVSEESETDEITQDGESSESETPADEIPSEPSESEVFTESDSDEESPSAPLCYECIYTPITDPDSRRYWNNQVCEEPMNVTADLVLKVSDNDTFVVDSGPTGSFPVDLPYTKSTADITEDTGQPLTGEGI